MIGYYIFLGLGAFIFSLIGTRLTILALRNRQFLMDIPNPRSNHKVPVPRGGGIAVVFALVIFLLIADCSYWLMIGLMLLAAISLVDDWIRLSPLTRLIVQLMAVLVAVNDVQIPALNELMPAPVAMALLVVAWMWFINLFNFMDGIDGISGSEMVSIATGMVAITALMDSFGNPLSCYALVVLASGFGFLWWNWHPARIFLGDVGSIPIGYVLGYLLLLTAQEGYYYAALILPAYYLADGTITLIGRIIRRERVWKAHSDHFYQRAVRSGKPHDVVVRHIIGVNMLLIMLAALSAINVEIGWVYLSIAYGMVLAVLYFVMAHPPFTQKNPKG